MHVFAISHIMFASLAPRCSFIIIPIPVPIPLLSSSSSSAWSWCSICSSALRWQSYKLDPDPWQQVCRSAASEASAAAPWRQNCVQAYKRLPTLPGKGLAQGELLISRHSDTSMEFWDLQNEGEPSFLILVCKYFQVRLSRNCH